MRHVARLVGPRPTARPAKEKNTGPRGQKPSQQALTLPGQHLPSRRATLALELLARALARVRHSHPVVNRLLGFPHNALAVKPPTGLLNSLASCV